jgi:Wings apart-like protein regulation of heterochromatin
MFVMSQDQLNMDLDRASLELMLNLLDTDASHTNALDTLMQQGISCSQLEKNKQKVREVCAEIKSKGHAKHLNLDNITVSLEFYQKSDIFSLRHILGW